jgi:DNA-binding CsgD family transcriptional regulator
MHRKHGNEAAEAHALCELLDELFIPAFAGASAIVLGYGPDRRVHGTGRAGPLADLLLPIVRAEHALCILEQRAPRVFATRSPIAGFGCARTVLCGDERFGLTALAIVAKGLSDGPFSSGEELTLLELAASCAGRVRGGMPEAYAAWDRGATWSGVPSIYVLRADLQIDTYWQASEDGFHLAPDRPGEPLRLNPDLEQAVASAVAGLRLSAPHEQASKFCFGRDAISLCRLSGRPVKYAVTIAPLRKSLDLAQVSLRYGLSAREADVLSLLSNGATTAEIADTLRIAQSTIRDHIKKILGKTASRSRAQLLSRILNPLEDGT